MIHPPLFFPPSQSLFCPIFLDKQLFMQTAALAIHCSREAIKKSSQCCVSVDPFLFLHIILTLMPPVSLTCTRTHKLLLWHTHMLMSSPIKSVRPMTNDGGVIWRFTFFPKAPNYSDMAPLDLRHC